MNIWIPCTQEIPKFMHVNDQTAQIIGLILPSNLDDIYEPIDVDPPIQKS